MAAVFYLQSPRRRCTTPFAWQCARALALRRVDDPSNRRQPDPRRAPGHRGRLRGRRARARRRGARGRGAGGCRPSGARRHAGLRHQYGLRRAGRDGHPAGRARRAADQPAAQPRRRRRRSAPGPGGARVDGAPRQRPGQGLFRNPAIDARAVARPPEPSRSPAGAEPRVGGRERRPRPARAPFTGAHRRGPGLCG